MVIRRKRSDQILEISNKPQYSNLYRNIVIKEEKDYWKKTKLQQSQVWCYVAPTAACKKWVINIMADRYLSFLLLIATEK